MAKKIADELSQLKEERDEAVSQNQEESVKLVLFRLDEEIYGLAIDQVKEIIKRVEVTEVPNAPDYIQGLIDLRGEVVVVIDPEKRFHLQRKTSAAAAHVIICKSGSETFGMVVDEVLEILTFPQRKIEKVSEMIQIKIHPNFLSGTGIKGREVFVILDAAKILTAKDFDGIRELTAKEEQVGNDEQKEVSGKDNG